MRDGWAFLDFGCQDLREVLALAPLDGGGLTELIRSELERRVLPRSEVVRRSRLNQTFAYQIIAGTRRPSRDKLIQLAFGLGLGVDGACDLLERGGASALLPTVRRDVIVAYCLSRGLDISACDDLLWELGERTLVFGGEQGVEGDD